MMPYSKQLNALIDDAHANDIPVSASDNSVKFGPTRDGVSIVVQLDGTSYRTDIPLDYTVNLRTYAERRAALGLEASPKVTAEQRAVLTKIKAKQEDDSIPTDMKAYVPQDSEWKSVYALRARGLVINAKDRNGQPYAAVLPAHA